MRDEFCLIGQIDGLLVGIVNTRSFSPKLDISLHTLAIERGLLQNLIFDNHALTSHRAMAAILGVILKLPPIKQALASQQVKSRYLESLVTWGTQRYTPA